MEEERDFRAAASGYAQYFADVRRSLTSEYATDARWLTASLFALNAGGLASLASSKDPIIQNALSGILFWFGVMLAFACVVYSQIKTRIFAEKIQKIENIWVIAASLGDIDEVKLKLLEAEKNSINTRLAPILSSTSFAAFSLGILAMILHK